MRASNSLKADERMTFISKAMQKNPNKPKKTHPCPQDLLLQEFDISQKRKERN